MIECECKYCHKKFKVYPSRLKKGGGKFCSLSCSTTYRNIHNNPTLDKNVREKISKNHQDIRGENNPMYGKRGTLAPSYIDGRSKYVGEKYRKIALANLLYECKICGETENLDVHHIDGNHNNDELSNLCFLCKKCHNEKAHKRIRNRKGEIIKTLTIPLTKILDTERG